MKIYTVEDFNKVFEDILNRTNNYEDNEFKKLVLGMFEVFRNDEFTDEIITINTPDNIDIDIYKNLYNTFKKVREKMIKESLIKSEFNNVKNLYEYKNKFNRSFDIYVNQSKNSINAKLEDELIL